MPSDNFYREDRMPSPGRVIWQHFTADIPAMIGFTACCFDALAIGGTSIALMRSTSNLPVISCCRLPGLIAGMSPSSSVRMISAVIFSAV